MREPLWIFRLVDVGEPFLSGRNIGMMLKNLIELAFYHYSNSLTARWGYTVMFYYDKMVYNIKDVMLYYSYLST